MKTPIHTDAAAATTDTLPGLVIRPFAGEAAVPDRFMAWRQPMEDADE